DRLLVRLAEPAPGGARASYCGMPAATQRVTTSCCSSVTHSAGRGLLTQTMPIGIQPSMIAGTVHSPISFGIVLASPSLKQADGASGVTDGLRAGGDRAPGVWGAGA